MANYIKLTDNQVYFWLEEDYWVNVINPFQNNLPTIPPYDKNTKTIQFNAFVQDPTKTPAGTHHQFVRLCVVLGVKSIYPVVKSIHPVVRMVSGAMVNGQPTQIPVIDKIGFTIERKCTCDPKQFLNNDFEPCSYCKEELAKERIDNAIRKT